MSDLEHRPSRGADGDRDERASGYRSQRVDGYLDGPAGEATWWRQALAEPVASRPEARARIVQAARGLPAPRRVRWPLARFAPTLLAPARWRRRGALTGLGGALLSTLLAVVLMVRHGEELAWRTAVQAEAMISGDSVVFPDTLRIVQIALRGVHLPAAAISAADARVQASLVRTHIGEDEWRARALVPRDMVALTLVIDGTPHALRLLPAFP